ncbi:MarR family transcriptional regulator [Streptomyces gossypii]
MPGGRLTQQDRQHIASGLTQGLRYAEIARQLGRPTSTVSREVIRNGGTDSYRADRAQFATGRRARRRGTAPPAEPPTARDAHGRDPGEVRGFAEQFAAMMVRTGVPRMAARVLARLFTADSGTLTAAELVRDLQVSPASVSKAIGYLEELEVVRRERDPRRRRERYVIDDDVWLRAWTTSARTHAMWAEAAQRGVEILDPATPAGARLNHMSRFFARLSEDMAGGPAEAVLDDALTLLAALVHTRPSLTAEELAAALGWTPDRVHHALHATAGPERLNRAQQAALGRLHADQRPSPENP